MVMPKLDVSNYPTPHPIDTSFFSMKGAKNDILINNKTPNESISATSRWFSFSFTESVYLKEIKIICEGYETYNAFELVVDHIDGTKHSERVYASANTITLKLGKLCSGFKFKPEPKIIISPKIISVEASGFTLEEFHRFESSIKEIDNKLSLLNSNEGRLLALQTSIKELKAELSSLESEIGKSRSEAEQLRIQIAQAEKSLSVNHEKEVDLEADISSLNENRRSLLATVAEQEKKRDEIVREIRLFPSEIAGFVKEGNRSSKWYIGIGAPFLILLLFVTHQLFFSAIDLTQLWKRPEGVDIWVVFLTRLPFVILALALIEVCGYVVGRLVFEIVRINRQRLEFAKLSIIAKDVSAASADISGTEQIDVFNLETKLKMELLREHMKNYTGSEFEYKGSALIAAITGVADRVSSKVFGKE